MHPLIHGHIGGGTCARPPSATITQKKSYPVAGVEFKAQDFIFLKNFELIKYETDYGSMTLDKKWSYKKQIVERANSLKRVVDYIANLCKKYNYKKIIELGSGTGASIYSIKKLIHNINIDCIEYNNKSRILIEKEFPGTKAFKSIEDVNDKYDLIIGIQVFEHFVDPLLELKKIEKILHKEAKLYFLFPKCWRRIYIY